MAELVRNAIDARAEGPGAIAVEVSETVVEAAATVVAAARFDGRGPAGFLQEPYMLSELRAAVRGALDDGSPGNSRRDLEPRALA